MAKINKLDQIRALGEARLKSSRGGVESRHARENLADESETLTKESHPYVTSVRSHADVVSGPPRRVPALIGKSAGVAPGPREAKRKTGRPRIEDRDKTLKKLRPWIALGMSERTWFRRQAEQRQKAKQ